MWTTPAPPFTALVASSIWSGVGEVNTSPGHAASSIPGPTKPPCIGSWPEPPPDMSPTLPCTGASMRTMTAGSYMTRTRSPCAASTPWRASCRTPSGALMSFFIAIDLDRGAAEDGVEEDRAKRAADQRAEDGHPGVRPIRPALARDRQDRVHDPRPQVTRRVDRITG